MIYSKLTIRNLKRSIREYLIFMMTVTITMMLMYAFNSLIFHDEVQTLMRNMDGILTAFVSVSVLLVFVIGNEKKHYIQNVCFGDVSNGTCGIIRRMHSRRILF